MIREEKREKLFFYLLFAGLVFGGLLVLQACAPAGNALAGTSWRLLSMTGAPLVTDTQITLVFDEEGGAGGSACNSYGAAVTVKGDAITFKDAMNTEMYCMDPEGIMDQESAYLQNLVQAESFEIKENRLLITLADGNMLIFESFSGM